MVNKKSWTADEDTYLQDKWGVISIKSIAKKLNRSVNAVKLRAQRTGLGDARFNFDGITVNQLSKALDRSYACLKGWIKNYDMPVKPKVFASEKKVLVIRYEDFWKWAEQHKTLMNFAKLEENILGPEPEWVKILRAADRMSSQKTKQAQFWSKQEDEQLLQLVKSPNITYPELAKLLNRSEVSIRRRLYDLNSKFLPVRLNNHIKYTPEDIAIIKSMAVQGYSYELIAERIGKSALGVRGKLERMNFDFKKRQFREVI